MDARTLEALEKSITHWAENIEAREVSKANIFADHCALCKMFAENKENEEDECDGCPVYERTGAQNCDHRRWRNCWAAYKNWQAKPESVECRNSFRTAAQEMHDFLVSLRPQQET